MQTHPSFGVDDLSDGTVDTLTLSGAAHVLENGSGTDDPLEVFW